ncbi:hypothetical protein RhiirA4_524317 [Rhizophagus irregularis]|uniref:Uncharacterized protein n=1 Tax=Rhizophagus irregularis TaxID=588596 RepID=A0A2I1GNG1_9GLOM|nr:hypothetical protein RhiirA4_524317 [Rhizophagus irregularis]
MYINSGLFEEFSEVLEEDIKEGKKRVIGKQGDRSKAEEEESDEEEWTVRRFKISFNKDRVSSFTFLCFLELSRELLFEETFLKELNEYIKQQLDQWIEYNDYIIRKMGDITNTTDATTDTAQSSRKKKERSNTISKEMNLSDGRTKIATNIMSLTQKIIVTNMIGRVTLLDHIIYLNTTIFTWAASIEHNLATHQVFPYW